MSIQTLLKRAWVILLALAWAVPAYAGGWAVVTVDELPAQITAGQPFTIGFVVRQHGQTLRADLTPILRFDRIGARETFTALARPQGQAGHYAAAIMFPAAGEWNWQIDIEQAGMLTQPMPALAVDAPAAPIVSSQVVNARANWLPFYVVSMIQELIAAARGSQLPAPQAAAFTPEQIGWNLFLAKGCVMCHEHSATRDAWADFGSVNIGPNLTTVQRDPDYLRAWLKDPSALKPGTQMPTLGLTDGEIDSLVAFLTANEQDATLAAGQACPITPALDERPPDKHLADWSPQGRWFKSPDGKIWVAAENLDDLATLGLGKATKVLWGKPAGLDLSVIGRRLDAKALPLIAQVLPYYHDDNLNPSGIGVPTPGCWEIEARAGDSLLRIVLEVPSR